MLCDIAWSRHNAVTMIIPPEDTAGGAARAVRTAAVAAVERNMPGLPAYVLAMMDLVPEGTCERCVSFTPGLEEREGGARRVSCWSCPAISAARSTSGPECGERAPCCQRWLAYA